MAENGKVGLLIGLFVLIIIGSLFAGILGNTTQQTSSIHQVNNQTFSFVNNVTYVGYQAVRSLNNIITTGMIVGNSTNISIGSNNFDSSTNGTVILKANRFCLASTCSANVTYSFYDELYVKDGTSRVLIGLIVLFFVLGVLLLTVGKSITKDMFGFE